MFIQQSTYIPNPNNGTLDSILGLIMHTITRVSMPVAIEYAYMVFHVLVAGACATWGIQMMSGKREVDVEKDFSTLLLMGVFAVGLREAGDILYETQQFFIRAGVWIAEGNEQNLQKMEEVMNFPSRIIDLAFDFGDLVLQYVGQHEGMELLYNAFSIAFVAFAFIVIFFVFVYVAWVVLAAQLNFWFYGVFGVMFIPLMLYKPTEQIGKTCFMGILTHGTKFMILSFLITLTYGLMSGLVSASTITWDAAFDIMVTAMVLGALVFSAGKLADSILQGAPTMGGGDIVGGIAKTALAGVGAVAGAAGAGALLSKGLSSSAQGGSYLGGGASAAAKEAKASGASRLQQIGAGIKGAATNATSGRSPTAGMREKFSAGKQNYQNKQAEKGEQPPKGSDKAAGESKAPNNGAADKKESSSKDASGKTSGAPESNKSNAPNESTGGGSESSYVGDSPSKPNDAPQSSTTQDSKSTGSGSQTQGNAGSSKSSAGTTSKTSSTTSPNQDSNNTKQEQPDKPKPNVASRVMEKASSTAYKGQMVDQATPRDDNPKPVQPPKDSDR